MTIHIREQAVNTLLRVIQEGAYSNLETKKILRRKDIKDEDKGLYLSIVYGTLQNRIYLDYILSGYVKKPLNKLDPEVLEVLRTAVYQVYFLDKIPPYAVVNEAVNLMGKRMPRAKGFVNGVLRNVLRDGKKAFDPAAFDNEKEALSVRFSIPIWVVHKYYEAFGAEMAEGILPLMNDHPPFTIRVNTLKTSKEDLRKGLTDLGITVEDGTLDADAFKLSNIGAFDNHVQQNAFFKKGHFMIQDQGAMMAARLLAPEKNERLLDMCAAPGGKTTHLSQLMADTGTIIARDIFEHRLELIRETAERLGITNIVTEATDGSVYNAAEAETYDRILLDAPCSGLGIIRRKPEIRYGMTKKDRKALTTIQAKLLNNAAQYLKKGGTLVYCTCTVNGDENEKQIKDLLINHPEMQLEEDTVTKTSPLSDGCDCFFMCRLKKSY